MICAYSKPHSGVFIFSSGLWPSTNMYDKEESIVYASNMDRIRLRNPEIGIASGDQSETGTRRSYSNT